MAAVRQFVLLAAEAEMSLGDQQQELRDALRDQFGCDEGGYPRFCLCEAFNDYVIARNPETYKLYRVPYTRNDKGVTFGAAQEVTTAYVPVAEACSFVAEAESASEAGKYPVRVLQAGWGSGSLGGSAVPHYYPPKFVQAVAEACGGKPFGRQHPDQKGGDPTGALDPSRIAGWLDGGRFDASSSAAFSTITLLDAENDLRSRLDSARKAGRMDLYGVSMLAAVGFVPGNVEGKPCMVAESLHQLYSVDLCARAGAGGKFLAAEAAAGLSAAQTSAINSQSSVIAPGAHGASHGGAASASQQKGNAMKETLQKLLAALIKKNATRGGELSLKFATTAEADYPALLSEVTDAMVAAEGAVVVGGISGPSAITAEAAQGILAEAQRVQSRARIEQRLTESKLPAPAAKLARMHLESALAAEADLKTETIDNEIKLVREAFAAAQTVGRIVSGGIVSGLDSTEKLALAMECALGVKEAMGKGVAAFRGIREAYVTITGDHDLSRLNTGGFSGVSLASEAIATSDFPNLLLNSMTKRLMQDYAELGVDGLETLYTAATITDYKRQDRVREGYLGELATVAENGTYQEITKPTDEAVNYTLAKRGGLLTISEETIRNDDLGAIARFPGRMSRAGRFTLKKFITNFFANNTAYIADTLAWFHATHSNLAAMALSQDALIAAELSLMTQTEKDSGEPLGLSLYWLMVPPALKATAVQINQTNTAGSNAFYQRFGANNERIIVNALLSDANDWYYGTRQEDAPFLEIGFLDGIKTPQIFLANQPTIGTQFTADQLQYKVKFPFGGTILDYRGVGKRVVA